jgi:NTP pyrophosphatase (non-canonical NTP hydrolase)
MDLNYYKNETLQLCKKKGWENVEVNIIWMLLTEELGELASAVRRDNNQFQDRKKISIEGEIMDVLSYLFQLSYLYNIDLNDA